jgi:hypothetical protein
MPPTLQSNRTDALPPAQRRVREASGDAFLLLVLGASLLYTNGRFTFVDDETHMLNQAARPVGEFLASLGSLLRAHEHPPLYDIFLNVWVYLTGGVIAWLRVPSVVFFVAGMFCLSRAAGLLGGAQAARALLWLGLLWPYGFHFGRLAGWYSLVFLLISALTWAYLRHAAAPSLGNWAWVCVLGVALVCANYLGWALLFFLAVDDWLRNRAQPGTVKRLVVTAGIFAVAYAPLWPAFLHELSVGTNLGHSWTYRLLNLAYNVYVLFVSESVGPWFWWLGVPAALAVAGCLLLTVVGVRGDGRRFLLFGAVLVAAMALAGVLYPRRLFVVAPWFLLSIAAGIGTIQKVYWRSALALSLGLVAAAGWYGISTQRYYAAPRFFEPWESVAAEAAEAVRGGALVVGNNPSFFFYLTYALEVPETGAPWRFSGVLTESVQHPEVWEPEAWEAAGRPLQPLVLWVRGMPGPEEGTPMAGAGQWLDGHCPGRTVRYLARDPSYEWKKRFAPELSQLVWRVEIRQYSCTPAGAPANSNTPAPTP